MKEADLMGKVAISLFVVATLLAAMDSASAVRPDECEQQRALYPKNWNDVSKEAAVFKCQSHYSGALMISIGARDERRRSLMSLVPLKSVLMPSQVLILSARFTASGWMTIRHAV